MFVYKTKELTETADRESALASTSRPSQRLVAEMFGTAWLVIGGCGSAVMVGTVPGNIGMLGVALAFGLTILTIALAIGRISGCHLNPAVTLGLWSAKRFRSGDVMPYIGAQLCGGLVGAGVVYVIATGSPHYNIAELGLAQNGYGPGSPGGFSLASAFLTELVLTFAFVLIIIGVTSADAPKDWGPIAIGMALTLIHLISIPVTNTSVNPARSTGPALLVGGLALDQLWLFWVAPVAGGLLAGLAFGPLFGDGNPQAGVGRPTL